jgi:hypothetical protein
MRSVEIPFDPRLFRGCYRFELKGAYVSIFL